MVIGRMKRWITRSSVKKSLRANLGRIKSEKPKLEHSKKYAWLEPKTFASIGKGLRTVFEPNIEKLKEREFELHTILDREGELSPWQIKELEEINKWKAKLQIK